MATLELTAKELETVTKLLENGKNLGWRPSAIDKLILKIRSAEKETKKAAAKSKRAAASKRKASPPKRKAAAPKKKAAPKSKTSTARRGGRNAPRKRAAGNSQSAENPGGATSGT